KKSEDRIKPHRIRGSAGVKAYKNPINMHIISKTVKYYVLYYEQTSPLGVPLYAFGHTKSRLKP
ncbi:MAG: hypothetical protein IJM97_02590, partial [Clostridia bacterium]|nr:hypothetical protein [Clostridia bacterium]